MHLFIAWNVQLRLFCRVVFVLVFSVAFSYSFLVGSLYSSFSRQNLDRTNYASIGWTQPKQYLLEFFSLFFALSFVGAFVSDAYIWQTIFHLSLFYTIVMVLTRTAAVLPYICCYYWSAVSLPIHDVLPKQGGGDGNVIHTAYIFICLYWFAM